MQVWLRTAAAIAACLAVGCMGEAAQDDQDDQDRYAPPAFTTTAPPDVVNEARAPFSEYWPPEALPKACALFAAHDWSYADAWAAVNKDAPPVTETSPPNHTRAAIGYIARAVHDVVVPPGDVFAVVADNRHATDKYPRYPRIFTRADWAAYEAAVETRQRAVTQAFCAQYPSP